MRFHPAARAIAALLAWAMLGSGCAFLIPDNPSSPRYNTVIGTRHAPVNNAATLHGAGSGSGSNNVPGAMPPPATMNDQPMPPLSTPVENAPMPSGMNLPPVDMQTQMIAQQQLQEPSPRSVPPENPGSGAYPVLNEVPPAIKRTKSDDERLAEVRAELEQDRANAAQAKDQLNRDAAAEPSMLSEMPPAAPTVPPPVPVSSAPLAPPMMPVSMAAPMPEPTMPAALPPPPPMMNTQPVPPAPMPVAQAPIQLDALPMGTAAVSPPPSAPVPVQQATPPPSPAPMPVASIAPAPTIEFTPAPAAPAMEPIQLRPPAASTPPPAFVPTPASAPAPTVAMAPAAGSFDPMAGAASGNSGTANNGTTIVSNQYLPASRYSYRR